YFRDTNVSLHNCILTGNSGLRADGLRSNVRGGGVYANHAGLSMHGCTVIWNNSGSPISPEGGGIVLENCSGKIANSILWHNVTTDLRCGPCNHQAAQLQLGASALTVEYSCVEAWHPLLPGVGSFDADPVFRDSLGFDG